MKHEAFKQQIKQVNEQFHVVQTEGTTEVHWIYGGFDVYEKANRKPQYTSPKKQVGHFFKRMISEEETNNQPLYHIIAEISEVNEHVVHLTLDASRIPENMRRTVLPVITEYVQTRLDDRKADLGPSEPVVKSADEIRKERRAQNELTPHETTSDLRVSVKKPEKGDK